MGQISKKTFKFLEDLRKNNNKEWFDKNKDRYLEAKSDWESFLTDVHKDLLKFEPALAGLDIKKCTFRINRDVRFSKDKTPYKSTMSAVFVKGGKNNKDNWAGYYMRIEPGNKSVVLGGSHAPPAPWIGKIRENIDKDAGSLRKIIGAAPFKKQFGEIRGEKLKTAPKGYPKDHKDIDLLQYKDFLGLSKVSDTDATGPGFQQKVIEVAKAIKPLNDWLNQ